MEQIISQQQILQQDIQRLNKKLGKNTQSIVEEWTKEAKLKVSEAITNS